MKRSILFTVLHIFLIILAPMIWCQNKQYSQIHVFMFHSFILINFSFVHQLFICSSPFHHLFSNIVRINSFLVTPGQGVKWLKYLFSNIPNMLCICSMSCQTTGLQPLLSLHFLIPTD